MGACLALDGGASKVCVQQKATLCPCGTTENANGFCVPTSGSCAPSPCDTDLQCPSDLSCRPTPACTCEPRCRWNFATGREDAPGCSAGQVCWVDNANLAAGSALFGYGRCRAACVGASDCNMASATNPFGGSLLKCASELTDAGMSAMRCRAAGACMDDFECALPAGSAARGYCNRSTFVCQTDCRLATNPVTTLPFNDCNVPNSCKVDAGMNVCVP